MIGKQLYDGEGGDQRRQEIQISSGVIGRVVRGVMRSDRGDKGSDEEWWGMVGRGDEGSKEEYL